MFSSSHFWLECGDGWKLCDSFLQRREKFCYFERISFLLGIQFPSSIIVLWVDEAIIFLHPNNFIKNRKNMVGNNPHTWEMNFIFFITRRSLIERFNLFPKYILLEENSILHIFHFLNSWWHQKQRFFSHSDSKIMSLLFYFDSLLEILLVQSK